MSIDTDYDVLREVLEMAPDMLPGWAVEFGVYSGYSLGIIAEHMPVIGFDSFKGLPEDWREGFPKGAFAIPEDGPTIQDILLMGPNRMVVPGWFEDTVPTFPFPPLALVHIDCDLYSSTVAALGGVLPYISPGTVVVFDEYHGYEGWEDHEAKAWREFTTAHRIAYQTITVGEQELAVEITAIGAR